MGEHQGQVAGIAANALVLQAVHEDAAVGNEHIVKDGQGFHVADLGERSLDKVALVVLAGQSHQLDAVPVGGQGEGNGVLGVFAVHELGGVDDDLVHIGSVGVADLGAPDDDALGGGAVDVHAVHVSGNDVHELIGVGLLVRSLVLGVTGALHVGLGAVADQIILLAVLDVSLETLVVLGAAGLVAVIGDGEQSVHGVSAHAALHAAAHPVTDQTGHELLLQQVIHALVDVGAAVVNGAVGILDHAHISILGIVGGVVALLHDIGAAHDPVGQVTLCALLAVGTVDLLAVQVDVGLHFQEPLFVLFISSDCHKVTSKTFFIGESPVYYSKRLTPPCPVWVPSEEGRQNGRAALPEMLIS